MKTIQVELPDKVDNELDAMVQAGWFRSKDEVVRQALLEFVRRNQLELQERFQQDDIMWALQQKSANE
ncbi:MAG TPA: ribbon-helix-helix domain-containing protein [Chloroflexia bacterium]|jgi:Arc/MetJ-type ribon-helix-helix transcriptional regulator